jgi:alanine-glyoxylate transaminase/serine-glyoxylate transaminase/serine-pyruvate transaminase
MNSLLKAIEPVLLMGPGPSTISNEVYQAIGLPTLSHLDGQFIGIMDALKENLKKIFRTGNEATFAVSGTGTAGMEACIMNLIEPGEAVLVLVNGYFGQRLVDMAGRAGGLVESLEFEWGKPVELESVKKKLGSKKYRVLAMVHAETSTGVRNPIREVGALLAGGDTLFLVDAVTSLGGVEIQADAWGLDAVYSCSQKCLACPSGLSPVTFSPRAVRKASERKNKIADFYLDLGLLMKYWSGAPRAYHHTAPANMFFALLASTDLLLAEGLEQTWKRHADAHGYLVSRVEAGGLAMLVDQPWRLPMLNTVRVPAGLDEAALRRDLRQKHKIEIGAGLGPLAGKIWRIGLMGHTARRENVDRLMTALLPLTK